MKDASPSILVTTAGNVRFGINPPQGFHHTFVLDRDTTKQSRNSYFVASSVFRKARKDNTER